MFRIVQQRLTLYSASQWSSSGWVRMYAVFASPEELEQPCIQCPTRPSFEPVLEPRIGTHERNQLCQELTSLCYASPDLYIKIGSERPDLGQPCAQTMPFEYDRAAAHYYQARPETIRLAMHLATECQRDWERRSVEERCAIIEKAASLIAGQYRYRIAAAAMVGQGMTAIQAEYNICQLIDYLRYGCVFMRDLTKSRCVVDGGREAYNRNQYHGLEGFWAAITSSDSLVHAAQLAITPAIMGNCVVWKPSDHSVLACYRVFECLQAAGLPPGVINFVPAEKQTFLHLTCSNPKLAGISFSGTTRTLENIWQAVGYRIHNYARFPRIVGNGSGSNFHVVHSSAWLPNAVACTARAAFEMAGQKAFSCSRVFVAETVLTTFLELLVAATRTLLVCHPLDYRCFTSALVSRDAYEKVVDVVRRLALDQNVKLLCGGRCDGSVGYFVEPTVYLVKDPAHELMVREVRGPLLTVCSFPDEDYQYLESAVSQSPYAITGSIFAQEAAWARRALGALRDCSAALCVNERCCDERPAQQSVGATRKSGSGAKAGSISYLLHFCTERSLREVLRPSAELTYRYMDEAPQQCVIK